jgi:hypothetical protein
MALKGFESSKQRSRYEDAVKARREAANKMIIEAEAASKAGIGENIEWAGKGLGTVGGALIGSAVGMPVQGALAGYKAGEALGTTASGVYQGDPEKVAGGVVSGASQAASAGLFDEDPPELVPGVDSSLQLEADADVAAGADILAQLTPLQERFYNNLTDPEEKAKFIQNQIMLNISEGYKLKGFE